MPRVPKCRCPSNFGVKFQRNSSQINEGRTTSRLNYRPILNSVAGISQAEVRNSGTLGHAKILLKYHHDEVVEGDQEYHVADRPEGLHERADDRPQVRERFGELEHAQHPKQAEDGRTVDVSQGLFSEAHDDHHDVEPAVRDHKGIINI